MRISDWSSDVCSSDLVREAGWVQRRHKAKFALDRMRGRQQLSEWLSTKHIAFARRINPVGRVGLTARKLLQGCQPGEARHYALQPAFKNGLVEVAHPLSSRYLANSERAIARAWTSSGPSAIGRAHV